MSPGRVAHKNVLPATRPLAGVMVLHMPDETVLANIHAAARQVDVLYIVDNTPSGTASTSTLDLLVGPNLRVIHRGTNLGLGTAYNLSCERAVRDGHEWVVLLDQDTLLFDQYRTTMENAIRFFTVEEAQVVGIAGPGFEYFSAPGKNSVVKAEYELVEAIVSSGSVLSLPSWRSLGGFREDFFIDYIDVEFCRRATKAGYAVLAVGRVLMRHGIGNSAPGRVWRYERVTSNYPPGRHYYIMRNFIFTLTGDFGISDVSWGVRETWKRIKFSALSVAMEPRRIATIRFTLRGILDGLRGRSGPIP